MKLPKIFQKPEPAAMKQTEKDVDVLIAEIHDEFNSAGEKLYQEAIQLMNASTVVNEPKVKRLEKLGFTASKEVIEAREIIAKKQMSEMLAETISYYKVKYPLYKFITYEKLIEICRKYNLIFSQIGKYTGFVPDKNLKAIEDFVVDVADCRFVRGERSERILTREEIDPLLKEAKSKGINEDKIYNYLMKDGIYPSSFIMIAAPPTEFNISPAEMIQDFQIVAKPVPIPDPVVFVPVIEGFLIITAWGREASDPIVKNESEN